MPALDEIAGAAFGSSLHSILKGGLDTVSNDQTVVFTRYTRRVLPLDGYVFWVRSSLLGDATAPVAIPGDLHVASERTQAESETYSRAAVVFTTAQDAGQVFGAVAPNQILIGSIASDAGSAPVRFAFSRTGRVQQNAGLFHYSGIAILPQMASQIIDVLAAFNVGDVIATNSLPAWIALNDYEPFYGFGNQIPLYPAFLSEQNVPPPFGTIHIPSDSTMGMAAAPLLSRVSSHSQLVRDRVRVTLYGADSGTALSFLDCIYQYSRDYDYIGLMGQPVVREEQVTQAELGIIANKKTIDIEISYQQSVVRNIARQLILKTVTAVSPTYPDKWMASTP